MKDNLGLSNLLRRMNGEMPTFFKKVLRLSLIIGGASAAILAVPLTGGASAALIPPMLTTLAGYGLTIGAVGTALSKLTITDNNDVEGNKP